MACVYLARDAAVTTGMRRELAVKRLTLRAGDRAFEEAAALFAREFHTLVALSHPCVVEVYDYGVDELGPYYTMEHVEGGDLKERAPCAWREACSLAYDVCSVLALLHSRRLVHGDVSPRNVRVARAGRAKLIDFGALMSMGPCDKIIGTPAFVPPEVVSRLTSDARTDLYSLGATLYYALTGQLPYPASDFAGLAQAWQTPPPPPSHIVADVPEALDALVLSLLAQDPLERPSTTYEVMERLRALSGLSQPDEPALAQAHLRTPALQGRDEALTAISAQLTQMQEGRAGAVLIVGAAGEGRSRMLAEAVAMAKTNGAVVLRVGGAVGLVDQLIESFPELTPKSFGLWPGLLHLKAAASAASTLQPAHVSALTHVLCELAAEQALVIAADDVQRLDHAALSLLAALAADGGRRRLCVLATAERRAAGISQAAHEDHAHALLVSESRIIRLLPLSAADTLQLLGSMFGDVPNLSLLSARVHERARGNPRAIFDLLHYLMAEHRIVYARGGWTLPSVLSASDLPLSDEGAVQARIASLPDYARCMLWAHALAPRAAFRREDYATVIGLPHVMGGSELDRAVIELLSERFLRYDGRRYGVAHPAAASLALAAVHSGAPEVLQRVQRGLAAYYSRQGGAALLVAKHLFAAGELEQGLREVLALLSGLESVEQLVAAAQRRPSEAAEVLADALAVASEQRRAEREIISLEQWLMMLAPVVDSAYYARVGPSLRAKLERDSGYSAFHALRAEGEPNTQAALASALTQANEAHARRHAAAQGLAPEQAIASLARYVVVSIAIGSKTHDGALLASLPELLEPFTGLSPLIEALWHNAIAVCESSLQCQHLQARARWRAVLERLPSASSGDLQYVQYVRRAVMFALGLVEVRLGLAMASDWTEQLDADPAQAVNAMYLRKCLRLQAGDREGAQQCRKQAELLHLRATAEQMFTSNLLLELSAHALARDVQGVKQCWDRIVPLAARYPGWVAVESLARGMFHQLIGEPQQALQAYDASLSQVDLARDAGKKVVVCWPAACAGYVETLNELGRYAEARAYAERALQVCSERGIEVTAHAVVRALALAEAKSGEGAAARASARLSRLLDEQRSLGIKGIQLAATYEARAKVALSQQDSKSYREYARLGAAEYHEAHTSSLSTRYTGWWTKAPEGGFDTVQLRGSNGARGAGALERELLSATDDDERARRALALLCEARAVQAGRLYLGPQKQLELVAEHGRALFAGDLTRYVRELLTGATPVLGSALGPFERDSEQAWLLCSSQAGEENVLGVVVFPHASAPPELVRVTRALKIVASALQRADAPP